jgi:hypothetical protein
MVSDLNRELKDQLGERNLLKLSKTAFLCSRQVPASVVLKCYDWANKFNNYGKEK